MLGTAESYIPATDVWERLPDLPEVRHHTAVVALDGKLYVLGGHEGLCFTPQREVFVFDLGMNIWSVGVSLP